MTLLVLAGMEDPVARQLVQRLRADNVESQLLLCSDLARRGWSLRLGSSEPAPARAVVGNRPLAASDIRGVITRLWAVTAPELPFIHADDRVYAAAEMHAFVLAFLGALRCPLLNAPSPGCLAGPALSHEQWLQLAAREQIRARPYARRVSYREDASAAAYRHPLLEEKGRTREVTVVGEHCSGESDEALRAAARRLARAAGVELLRVVFGAEADGEPVFVHADYWINAADPTVVGALKERCGV